MKLGRKVVPFLLSSPPSNNDNIHALTSNYRDTLVVGWEWESYKNHPMICVINWNVQQVVVGACTRGCLVGIVGNPMKVLLACQKLTTYMKHEI